MLNLECNTTMQLHSAMLRVGHSPCHSLVYDLPLSHCYVSSTHLAPG